jgi:hypothetical protein
MATNVNRGPSMKEKLLDGLRKDKLDSETSTSAKRLTDGSNYVRGALKHQQIAEQYRNVNRYPEEPSATIKITVPPDYTRDHYHKAWAMGVSPAELARREMLLMSDTTPPLEAGRYTEEKTLPEPIRFNVGGPGPTWEQYAPELIPSRYTPSLPARPLTVNPASEIDLEDGEPYEMPIAAKYRRRRVAQQEARELLHFYGWQLTDNPGINLASAARLRQLIADGKIAKKTNG